jgi:hypothetical protein
MNHNIDDAEAFLRKCREDDPQRYADVCDKYPTISGRQQRRINQREIPVGLLGVQPAFIHPRTAEKYGVESVYADDE